MMLGCRNKRLLQVGSVMKKSLVQVLQGLGMKHVTVSEVKMSPDLKYATIFFFPLRFKHVVTEEHLNNLAPDIKRRLAKLVELRYLPEIRFKLDETFNNSSEIYALIDKKEF